MRKREKGREKRGPTIVVERKRKMKKSANNKGGLVPFDSINTTRKFQIKNLFKDQI